MTRSRPGCARPSEWRYSAPLPAAGGDLGLDRRRDDTTPAPSAAARAATAALSSLPWAAAASSTLHTYRTGFAVSSCRAPRAARCCGRPLQRARRSSGVQLRQDALDQRELVPGVRIAAARALGQPIAPALQRSDVGEQQLGLDQLDVAHGIDRAFDVGDVAALESTATDGGWRRPRGSRRESGCPVPRPDWRRARARRCRRLPAGSDDRWASRRPRRSDRGADRAPARARGSARSCRTDSSRPRPPPCR